VPRGTKSSRLSKTVHDPLTAFQVEVTTLFFGLDASNGFLLAGGAALLAQHLTERPTYDLDFFTRQGGGDVPTALAALEAAAIKRGWEVTRLTEYPTFGRLKIIGPDELTVDLAVDSGPGRPPVVTCLGPSFDPEELAGRKLIALFDRAAPRDFSDVQALAARYSKALLIDRAAEVDLGFDRAVLAQMFGMLSRYEDDEIPVASAELASIRAFFAEWAEELKAGS
jgi:hypothetical protein